MVKWAEARAEGNAQRAARIGFATPELLWKVLSAKIREAARRVQRDVKAVHGDITALLAAGLLNRTETGNVEFPYDAVKVEFLLQAA